jgi:hypothetical protein
MPLEASMPVGAMEEQHQSPVDVVISIRKELAEFQRTSSKQAWRAELREACKEALLQQAAGGLDIRPVVEYLEQRGLIRSKPSRAWVRRRPEPLPSPSERSGS